MVGIDVSKDTLDFCVLDSDTREVVKRGVLKNEAKTILNWLKALSSDQVRFALEHTGHYGALLSWLLSEGQYEYYMINPLDLKRSVGIQRGKSDVIDAYRIAFYAINQEYRLQPFKLPTKALRKLKVLMTTRDRFVKINVQHQNGLKALEILIKTLDIKNLIKEQRKQINSLKKLILKLEKQMQDLIKTERTLAESYQKITQVVGVGPITAIKCIVETDNFFRFTKARKFSCHCGLAPFPYQSGTSIKGKTKTHPFRNKDLKATLFKAAGSAIQHDPQLRLYYQKKTKEGKHKLSVLNAVANKLVLRIFAVVHREEPFVKLAA